MILTVAAVIGIAILVTNSSTPIKNTTIIESLETFKLSYGNLHKGKKITWDWEVEKNLLDPSLELNFWIEDSDGNKDYEIVSSKDRGSFTAPFTDKWTLKWENPYYHEESDSPYLRLAYKVEIVNQAPNASITTDKTSGPASLTISFIGAGVDYDGMIQSYHWDFGEGNTSNVQNPIHTFPNIGNYTVALTVTDNDGAAGNDTVKITVNTPKTYQNKD